MRNKILTNEVMKLKQGEENYMDYKYIVAVISEYLKEKKQINELERDIFSTIEIYMKIPFDRNEGKSKVLENNVKHIDVCGLIPCAPGRINKPFNQAADEDIRSNLAFQIEAMAIKDGLAPLLEKWKNM